MWGSHDRTGGKTANAADPVPAGAAAAEARSHANGQSGDNECGRAGEAGVNSARHQHHHPRAERQADYEHPGAASVYAARSEEHTSELQSLMRIPYAELHLQKKK